MLLEERTNRFLKRVPNSGCRRRALGKRHDKDETEQVKQWSHRTLDEVGGWPASRASSAASRRNTLASCGYLPPQARAWTQGCQDQTARSNRPAGRASRKDIPERYFWKVSDVYDRLIDPPRNSVLRWWRWTEGFAVGCPHGSVLWRSLVCVGVWFDDSKCFDTVAADLTSCGHTSRLQPKCMATLPSLG